MLITSITPSELVNWFHQHQDTQHALCVMLAPAQEDQKKLSALIEDLFNSDATLGNEVALLLLHPHADKPLGIDCGYGKFSTFNGNIFPENSHKSSVYPLRNVEIFRDMSSEGEPYRLEIAYQAARSTARFVPQFMQLFEVSQADLPAICVLVKGLDESIVLSLDKDWSPSSLLQIFAQIRGLVDNLPNFRATYQKLADEVPAKLPVVSDSTREILAKIEKIVQILELLVRRYGGSESDIAVIADFVARDCPSSAQLQDILANLSFSSNARYLNDGQRIKVINLMTRVELVRYELDNDIKSRSYILSIGDRARQLAERREKLFKDISNIRAARVKKTSRDTAHLLKRIGGVLERVNLAGDLGDKLSTAADWVKKLVN